MSARKIGLLILLLAVGGTIETAWRLRGDWKLGPEGCRVMGGRFFGPSYDFEQVEARPIASRPQLEVSNAFGAVRVSPGATGLVKARLRTVVYQPTEEKARAFANRVELRLSVDDAAARVETNREALGRSDDVGFETHLELEVPPDTAVTVRNEHGRVDVAGVRSAEITTSFDGVSVERLAGAAKLDGRHGELRASEIGGPLELRWRHGSVEVSDVRGATTIDCEHGDVTVRRSGRLEIRQRSGAVTAESVDGELVVRAGHSAVEAHDVRMGAEVSTSYAAVELVRIGGDLRAKVKHGAVAVEDVGGTATIESSYDAVRLDHVAGAVQATVHHGAVEGKGLAGGVRVKTSGGDVTLDGFSGPAEVELDRGNVRLSPRATLTAPVTVSVRHGEAELALPQGSSAALRAESRRGEAQLDVPGLDDVNEHGRPGHRHRRSGVVGGGGVAVSLRADGDVRIEAQPVSEPWERAIAKPEVTPAGAGSPVEPSEAVPAEAPLAQPTPSPQAERPAATEML